MNYIFISIFLTISGILSAQYSEKKIDSMQTIQISGLRKGGNLEEALTLNKEILKKAEEIQYKKGIIEANITIGNLLSLLGKNKESLVYLDKATKELEGTDDDELESKLYVEYARNYSLLGLRQKAIEYYDHATKLAENMQDSKKKKILLNYYYASKAAVYEEMGDTASFYKSLHLAYKLYPNPITASRLGKYFTVYAKNLDSAEYYLKKAESDIKTGNYNVHEESIVLRNFGRLYFAKKNYKEAISYYQRSLEISKINNKKVDLRDTYKLLYEAYKAENDSKNTVEYLEKYTKLNDSIQTNNRHTIDIPVTRLLQEKEIQKKSTQNKLYLIIAVILLIALFLLLLFRKTKKGQQQLLQENEEIILKHDEQTRELKLKVNESFDEVTELAKANSPEFWGRFQEVYPELGQKLLALNPELKLSELKLGAYIYLGFNTKDIAEFTFKAVKTIKNNKYNLRKRLQVPTEAEFTLWMRDLIENK
ncbi:tetratricopeptide repeat protein [Chryseobacterium shigense]|uniref:Tetratricopeptide (TPR) repeat protein n=1 Tax=Chryseobacterium shigense TaxID=297244 RepID=A0A841N4H5_9FLAO|nr:tetratricopeptide repeat protein [Chryseobacterium shigense]MBB6369641.1 tetratricopeptide (TPR) repeat protein [Chryseobacterium shigense]